MSVLRCVRSVKDTSVAVLYCWCFGARVPGVDLRLIVLVCFYARCTCVSVLYSLFLVRARSSPWCIIIDFTLYYHIQVQCFVVFAMNLKCLLCRLLVVHTYIIFELNEKIIKPANINLLSNAY